MRPRTTIRGELDCIKEEDEVAGRRFASKVAATADGAALVANQEKQDKINPSRVAALGELQYSLGYRFRDVSVLNLALTHSSVAYEEQAEPTFPKDNEQLEFLGDAVLGLVVTEQLFRAYPEFSEGEWTRLRAQFVSRKYLTRVAQIVNLGNFLLLGKGEEKSGGRKKAAILANAMEAVIAAVYLDGGMKPAAKMVRVLFLDQTLESAVIAARTGDVGDWKSMLQEHVQALGFGQPSYGVVSETGPAHKKEFVVVVNIVGETPGGKPKVLATATGTRKKQAEQEAARIALQQLRKDTPTANKAAQEE